MFLKEDLWRLLYVFGTKNTNPMQKYQKRSRVMKTWLSQYNNHILSVIIILLLHILSTHCYKSFQKLAVKASGGCKFQLCQL